MSYNITVSGTSYFEALDHLGTEAARYGVPEPSAIVAAGRGWQARYDGVTREVAEAILRRLEEAGDEAWISTLQGERGNGMYTAAEIRAAKACARDAEKVRAVLTHL